MPTNSTSTWQNGFFAYWNDSGNSMCHLKTSDFNSTKDPLGVLFAKLLGLRKYGVPCGKNRSCSFKNKHSPVIRFIIQPDYDKICQYMISKGIKTGLCPHSDIVSQNQPSTNNSLVNNQEKLHKIIKGKELNRFNKIRRINKVHPEVAYYYGL